MEHGNTPETSALIIKTIESIRELSTTLNPISIEGDCLHNTIKQFADKHSAMGLLEIACDPPESINTLPVQFGLKLYTILESLLIYGADITNAKRVSVKIRHNEDNLSLVYRDDGKGDDPSKGKLVGVYDQVAAVEGQISKYSTTNIGTMIRIVLPTAT